MAREIGGKVNYFKYTECEEGDLLVDQMVYGGTKEGKYGRQNVFKGNGEMTVLNKAGQLDYKLDEFITEGDTVSITYDGTEKLTQGAFKGKDVHTFKLVLHDEVANESGKDVAAKPEGDSSSLLDKLN